MKNFAKLIGIIAIAAIIGFTMAACDNGCSAHAELAALDQSL